MKTTIKHLLILLSFFVASAAWATDTMQTSVDAGKLLGASLGSQNPLGNSQTQQTVSGMLTVNGSTSGNNPSNGASLNGSQSGTMTLSCGGAAQALYGAMLKANGCSMSGSSVGSMQVSACVAGLNGGACDTSAWSNPVSLSPGGSASFGSNVKAGMTSCSASGCTLNVTVSSSLNTSGAALASQGSAQAAASGSNSAYGMTATTVNNGNYQASIQNMGAQYKGCVNDVNTSLNTDGVVYNCNKTGSYNFGANNQGAQCQTVTQCLQTATQTKTWTETCNTDVPIVQQQCTTVTPTQQCSLADTQQTYTCSKQLTVQVTSNAGCVNGQLLTTVNNDVCPRCYDYLRTYVYCATNGYNVSEYAVYKSNNAIEMAFYTNHYVSGGIGQSIPQTLVASNYSGGYCYSSFLSQSCTGTTCTIGSRFQNPCLGIDNTGYSSFPIPITYAYQDVWDDKCGVYENAP